MPFLLYNSADPWRRVIAWIGASALAPAGLLGAGLASLAQPLPLPVEPAVIESGQVEPGLVEPGMEETVFAASLASADLVLLEGACQDSARFDRTERLRLLRERLVALWPAPQPFGVVIANANALISCLAPEAALEVLDRFGPGPGVQRQQWLIQQWRAANAGLNHRRAASALRRLAAGNPASLEAMPLPMRLREDGSLDTRPALDVLADHLTTLGRNEEAAALLLAGRLPGRVAAERLQRAAQLLDSVPQAERDRLLELALDQAAAAAAWGMAAELLDLQRAMQQRAGGDGAAAAARRLRLSQRIDDAYAEWRLRQQDSGQTARADDLERQLRSPRAAGGHAASPADGPTLLPSP
ncbi:MULTISPECIES: hypothetical protein [unclassified Synechococcus]|uniref:hypothetical protein n=1 Tax=unclassified Synechococcus TaxID=2626047 RepID=UPI0021A86E49|nr:MULTISPECIES: hypothetical protein [unclassified Synechococcus]